MDAILDVTSWSALNGIYIEMEDCRLKDHYTSHQCKVPLSGMIIDRPPIPRIGMTKIGMIIDRPPIYKSEKPLIGDSEALVTLFLPKRTPLRVWRWTMDFLSIFAKKSYCYFEGLRVIQASFTIGWCALAEIGEFVKKCCSIENGFTFQISSWGIFYHNGDSFHFLGLKDSDVPMNFKARWNPGKSTGITISGLNLNGAQITTSSNGTCTTLRSIGPPSKGLGNLDELHIPILVEELKSVETLYYHATKVLEFDGISLVVRSASSSVVPSNVPLKSSLKEILQDGVQKTLPLRMKVTKPVLESISDLKTKQQLLVEYWKGVSQMEMIEGRNKVIIQLQNLQISTFNSAHSLRFIPMCPSSRDREYWHRALHDLREDYLSPGSSSQSRIVHSTGGRIKFLLGEFDSALLDFDRALLDSDRALDSNKDGLASTLLDRAVVKCVLGRYPEATQDINRLAEISPNISDLKRFQACLEDIVFLCMDSSKSPTSLLQPTQPVYDLLTGDQYPPIIKSVEEFGLSSISDWTEVKEPSKDLYELDLPKGTSYDPNCKPPPLLLAYLDLFGLEKGYDSLCTGEKLAEGGQAEIFEALGTPPVGTQTNLVLKVFKHAFPFRIWLRPDLEQFGGVFLDHPSPVLCTAVGVKFLQDGRCAFVFPRHWGDLRHLIHQRIVLHSPPFEYPSSVKIMLQIAEGMRILHIHNILHRDLKASNVLVSGDNPDGADFRCLVADFECAMGVMGTGFWRAPEILAQLNPQTSEPKALAWSKAADVYSFGMTCYEILTGDAPFQNLKASDWDVVLSGGRPRLPLFLDFKLRALIELCWHDDPEMRPSFLEICKVLVDVKGEQ